MGYEGVCIYHFAYITKKVDDIYGQRLIRLKDKSFPCNKEGQVTLPGEEGSQEDHLCGYV